MKKIFLQKLFQSKYCMLVFLLGLTFGYSIVPKNIFESWLSAIGIIYVILIALVLTCMVRVVKEKIVNLKDAGAGLLSMIASVIGLSAMQVCGVGAPLCGASIGAGLLSFIFPHSMQLFQDFSIYIIIGTIALQIIALDYMGCLRRCLNKS